ncbi:hypothetical protein XENORESO_013439, partial [Xenotaenia resolanae]
KRRGEEAGTDVCDVTTASPTSCDTVAQLPQMCQLDSFHFLLQGCDTQREWMVFL